MEPLRDPLIQRADDFQERFARDALRCAKDKQELIDAWFAEAESFSGAARERLQEEYSMRLRELGVGLE